MPPMASSKTDSVTPNICRVSLGLGSTDSLRVRPRLYGRYFSLSPRAAQHTLAVTLELRWMTVHDDGWPLTGRICFVPNAASGASVYAGGVTPFLPPLLFSLLPSPLRVRSDQMELRPRHALALSLGDWERLHDCSCCRCDSGKHLTGVISSS